MTQVTSDFTKCSVCGGKAYKVGTDTSYSEHCWDCGNVDKTEVVDFGGWRPMKRAE